MTLPPKRKNLWVDLGSQQRYKIKHMILDRLSTMASIQTLKIQQDFRVTLLVISIQDDLRK